MVMNVTNKKSIAFDAVTLCIQRKEDFVSLSTSDTHCRGTPTSSLVVVGEASKKLVLLAHAYAEAIFFFIQNRVARETERTGTQIAKRIFTQDGAKNVNPSPPPKPLRPTWTVGCSNCLETTARARISKDIKPLLVENNYR